MRHHRREAAHRHPVYLITRANYCDISQRCWNLTRLGGLKLQRMQNRQRIPVRYFVKSYQIPSRTGAKLSLKGIMCMADEAEMRLILLIPAYSNKGWALNGAWIVLMVVLAPRFKKRSASKSLRESESVGKIVLVLVYWI